MELNRHAVPALIVAVIALAIAVVALAVRGDETEPPSTVADALLTTAFAEQRVKGQDSAAKSDARNAVSEIEACYATMQDYAACELPSASLTVGDAPGQVEIAEAGSQTYTIVAHSESGAEFAIVRGPDFTVTRPCTPAGEGGCYASGDW